MNYLIIDKIINEALIEDGVFDDVTTKNICKDGQKAKVDIIFKEDGILCGTNLFKRVFEILGKSKVDFFFNEGDYITKGTVAGRVEGEASIVLSGERVALNLLQRMCGISTITNSIVKELSGTGIKIADTRKTTPNLRYIEKYAVKIGGGMNHRYNLSDMAMIKDNHIKAAGSITNAINAIREGSPIVKKVEVECETIADVREAVGGKADIIMLDNMSYDMMKEACEIIGDSAYIEVSGNITIEKIKSLKDLNIHYFSSGALTHSVKALDISMKNLELL